MTKKNMFVNCNDNQWHIACLEAVATWCNNMLNTLNRLSHLYIYLQMSMRTISLPFLLSKCHLALIILFRSMQSVTVVAPGQSVMEVPRVKRLRAQGKHVVFCVLSYIAFYLSAQLFQLSIPTSAIAFALACKYDDASIGGYGWDVPNAVLSLSCRSVFVNVALNDERLRVYANLFLLCGVYNDS